MTVAAYIVGSRRRFWAGRGAVAATLATLCGIILPRVDGVQLVLGWAGAAMFGVFALYALRQLLRSGPRLELSPAGVRLADMGIGFIPWGEIDHVQVFGSDEAPFIAFHVRDPSPYLARMPTWARGLAWVHARSGLPLFSINLIGVDREAAHIHKSAMSHWRAHGRHGEGRILAP